ncbi:LOW QUALITY PROTEIN: hypothetical protein Cgig2_019217 [Carnegiea gigantea]|uniref:Uncharacterized protein n=1 Tax=Carnegiea gigantea TaxID=171969 RepID=A0A9Q1GM11_9CARY|nr:LOW QUALITY PROTEIN: hypothetical protein Cgig2_019217 [Carnegiea gigantea]
MASASGITKEYSAGRREVTARTILWVRAGWGPREFRPFSHDLCNCMWPFHLSTDLPGPNDTSEEEELVDALSEDELLDECPEEELDEPILSEALELVEATSAFGLDWRGAEQGLPCVPSASNSSGDLMRGVDLVFAILHIISNDDLPRIRHLHLGAKDVGGGGILAAGP